VRARCIFRSLLPSTTTINKDAPHSARASASPRPSPLSHSSSSHSSSSRRSHLRFSRVRTRGSLQVSHPISLAYYLNTSDQSFLLPLLAASDSSFLSPLVYHHARRAPSQHPPPPWLAVRRPRRPQPSVIRRRSPRCSQPSHPEFVQPKRHSPERLSPSKPRKPPKLLKPPKPPELII
jgi:hypothetical protein